MVPCEITEDGIQTISPAAITVIHRLKYYVTERARTSRRFLSRCNLEFPISDIEIIEIQEPLQPKINEMLAWLQAGKEVGVMSESGMPGIADPGQLFAQAAHDHGFRVQPLVGPSSLFLALAASGLNGQSFAFQGYLPIKEPQLKKRLQNLNSAAQKGQTQIFIEAPYRNKRLFNFLLKYLDKTLRLTIATDVSGTEERIKTLKVSQWSGSSIKVRDKIPTIFLVGK